jgi:hypothetical protein
MLLVIFAVARTCPLRSCFAERGGDGLVGRDDDVDEPWLRADDPGGNGASGMGE